MAETLFTPCPKCGTQVSKSLSHCKKCGAKLKLFGKYPVKKWLGYFFLAWIVLATISQLSRCSNEENSSNSSNNVEIVNDVGQIAKEKKFEITLIEVQKRKQVGSYLMGEFFGSSPSSGGIYVVVSYKVKNISTKPVGVFSLPSIDLIDTNGTKYDSDLGASAYFAAEAESNAKVVSDLNPGLSYTDHEVFEVANDLYNDDWRVKISKSLFKVK